jgi:hypothetical protein
MHVVKACHMSLQTLIAWTVTRVPVTVAGTDHVALPHMAKHLFWVTFVYAASSSFVCVAPGRNHSLHKQILAKFAHFRHHFSEQRKAEGKKFRL